MSSQREMFWQQPSYVVVGNSARMPFPRYTYQGLKRNGKTVFAVDPSAKTIEGDAAYADFSRIPAGVQAAVLEVPNNETADWVKKAAEAGIRNIWIHWDTETPEALAIAREKGINVLTGTCAVMYLMPRTFPHCVHRWIMKLTGKY